MVDEGRVLKQFFFENALMQSYNISHYNTATIDYFTPWKMHMHMKLDHMASGSFWRDVFASSWFWPLAVTMPPKKVYQCPHWSGSSNIEHQQ